MEKFAPPNAPKTLGLINKGVHCDGVGPKISSFGSLSALLCGCVLREVKLLDPVIPKTLSVVFAKPYKTHHTQLKWGGIDSNFEGN